MGDAQRAGELSGLDTSGRPYVLAHVSPELLALNVGQVFVAVWRAKPTRELFEIQRSQLAQATARHRGSQLFLCIVEAKADPPDQDVRDASANMVTSHGRDLAACACVIEGSGFRSALTRTVLSGIAFVARSATPQQFFESTDAACKWLEKRAAAGSLAALPQAIERARTFPG